MKAVRRPLLPYDPSPNDRFAHGLRRGLYHQYKDKMVNEP